MITGIVKDFGLFLSLGWIISIVIFHTLLIKERIKYLIEVKF